MTTDRRFVFWSSPESIAEGKISLLAITEVILSVAAYWWIAITYNTHLHILVSIIAAPLVLLRSDASVAVAKNMWIQANTEKDIEPTSPLGLTIMTISALITGFLAYILATSWLADHEGLSLFWRSVVVGFLAANVAIAVAGAVAGAAAGAGAAAIAGAGAAAIAIAIAGAVAIAIAGAGAGAGAGAVVFAVVLPGVAFGFWLYTIRIRLTSVVRNLRLGWSSLPANWRQVMFAEDAMRSPELVPGISDTNFGSLFQATVDDDAPSLDWFFRAIAIPIWFLPTLVWRYSLKSTVWFYLLILLLTRPGALKNEDARKATVDGHPSFDARFGLWFAIASILAALIALTDWAKAWDWFSAVKGDAPLSPVAWLFVTDWARLIDQPWKWFSLAAAILTIILYIWMSGLHSRRKGARVNDLDADAICPLGASLYWTDRARNICVIFSFIIGIWYFTKISYQEGLLDPLAPVLRTIFG